MDILWPNYILEEIHFLVISRAFHHLVYFGFDGGYIQEQSANDTIVSVKCVCVFFGKASKDCSKLRLNKRPNNYRENRSWCNLIFRVWDMDNSVLLSHLKDKVLQLYDYVRSWGRSESQSTFSLWNTWPSPCAAYISGVSKFQDVRSVSKLSKVLV